MIGFAGAFGQILDLVVFDRDLFAEKFILPFQALDIARHCRVLSRRVGTGRCIRSHDLVDVFTHNRRRGGSRQVAPSREGSHLFDIGNVLFHRRRRDEIFLAERRFHTAAIEMAFRAIALDRAMCARVAGAGVALRYLLDGKGIFAVGTGRGLARQVGLHMIIVTTSNANQLCYPQGQLFNPNATLMQATVLFSGGIDSTSCIHLLKRDGYDVRGVFVDFGQASARMEQHAVRLLSRRLAVPVRTIRASSEEEFGAGELTGRNAYLIFSALLMGGCREGLLAIGIHAGTPYFDCSPAFIDRIDPLISEYTDGRVSIVAPFLNWKKDDVYSFFASTEIPLRETYSCELGTESSCGECASCRDRVRLECWQSAAR